MICRSGRLTQRTSERAEQQHEHDGKDDQPEQQSFARTAELPDDRRFVAHDELREWLADPRYEASTARTP